MALVLYQAMQGIEESLKTQPSPPKSHVMVNGLRQILELKLEKKNLQRRSVKQLLITGSMRCNDTENFHCHILIVC